MVLISQGTGGFLLYVVGNSSNIEKSMVAILIGQLFIMQVFATDCSQ